MSGGITEPEFEFSEVANSNVVDGQNYNQEHCNEDSWVHFTSRDPVLNHQWRCSKSVKLTASEFAFYGRKLGGVSEFNSILKGSRLNLFYGPALRWLLVALRWGYPVLCKLHEKVAVDSYDILQGSYGIETVDILYPVLCSHDSFYSMAFLLCMLKSPIHPNYPLLPLFRQLDIWSDPINLITWPYYIIRTAF